VTAASWLGLHLKMAGAIKEASRTLALLDDLIENHVVGLKPDREWLATKLQARR